MSHEKWDEEKIKELLKNAPKIHDHRSKEEVFERLKKDGLFDEGPPTDVAKKKKKGTILPGIISVAAILILAIMIPSYLKQQDTENAADLDNDKAHNEMDIQAVPDVQNSTTSDETEVATAEKTMQNIKTAVYPEQLKGNKVFRIGLVSNDADSIPITILIPDKKISKDFGKTNPSQVEMYNEYASKINEKLLGFVDYHPYVGEVLEKGTKVIHKLPEDHAYDTASAALSTYYATLTDTFSSYEEVEFVKEDETPMIFNEVGEANTLKVNKEATQYNYFKYVQQNGTEYLAPNFRETFTSVEEALQALKTNTNDIYKTVILPSVDYSVKVEGNVAKVIFTTKLDLQKYNQTEAMQMIEGILLTGASFNKQIQFENIVQTNWEGFDFTKPLPIPVGPNEVPYTVIESK